MAVSVANSHIFCREICYSKDQNQQQWLSSTSVGSSSLVSSGNGVGLFSEIKRKEHRFSNISVKGQAFWQGTAKPTTLEMEAITSVEHLDQILIESQEQSQPVIIDWMAAWCRKCIYLKPKLEKLAAEYDTKVKFYYVDVNNVSQLLVKRGNISKMPTIQLWKDGEMKEEVIGGHKAWLVIDEVREMIQKFI